MDNTLSPYEELLFQVVTFLDNPTLKNAIKLDKKWCCLIGKQAHSMLGPWVKTYLRHNFFTPQNKKVTTLNKHVPKPTTKLIKNLLPENLPNIPVPHLTLTPLLSLILNNSHQNNISATHLLACAIAPTTAFIIAESLTEDFEASLYAALMMFGIGIPALLLGNIFDSFHANNMPLQLMTLLIAKMERKRRCKSKAEKLEKDPLPATQNHFEFFAPKPISISFKAKLL